jgi:NAD-dependent histone deacetylase SIR2
MGNEESSMVDESTHPSVLDARNIDAVAKYVRENNVRKVVLMVRPHHAPHLAMTTN